MGHQVHALTASGERIEGPYFGRTFGARLYGYFEGSSSHNAGFSGDGKPLAVTTEQIWDAMRKVKKELADAQRRCEQDQAIIECLMQCLRTCDRALFPDYAMRSRAWCRASLEDWMKSASQAKDATTPGEPTDKESESLSIVERRKRKREVAASDLHGAVEVPGRSFTIAERERLLEIANNLAAASEEWACIKLLASLKDIESSLHFNEIYEGLLDEMLDFLKHCLGEGTVKIVFC